MATPSGLAAQWGFKAEGVYGTAALPVDRFLPLRSETIADTYGRIVADDIIAGAQARRQSQVGAGNRSFAGGVSTFLWNRHVGLFLSKLLGAVSTAGTGPYTHTITPGDQTGDSLTMQFGRPDQAGTVQSFTYEGVKVRSATIGATQGEFATLELDVIAQDVTRGVALPAPAYPSGMSRFTGDQLTVTVGGVSVPVFSFELTLTNPLDDTLRPVGTSVISEPLRNDLVMVAGSLELRWDPATIDLYTQVANLTWSEMVCRFDNGTDSLTFTMDVSFNEASQNIAGRGVIRQSVTFEASGAASDADAVTAVLVNSDAVA